MKVRAWQSIAAVALAACSASCGRMPRVGNVSLHVTIASDAVVDRVDYELTGVGLTEIKGSIETPAPAKSFERFISHVPAGKGYRVHAHALSRDGKLACDGASTFDVAANATTRVNLGFGCVDAGDGMVNISVGVACPGFKVASWTVSPLAASVGSTISVSASTSDVDADAGPSTFAWTASAGRFAAPTDAQTSYVCATAGTVVLTITATSAPCRDMQSVTVTCVADAGVQDDDDDAL
jgi:hypothetical protein